MNKILESNLAAAKVLVKHRTHAVAAAKRTLLANEEALQEAEEAVRFLERGVE